jgi:hypothetical protein
MLEIHTNESGTSYVIISKGKGKGNILLQA